MAQEKLTMKKKDVQLEISNSFCKNFHNGIVKGKQKPDIITNVLATIQDQEYIGAGKYSVLLDIYGSSIDKNGNRSENEHYSSSIFSVDVSQNKEGEPEVEFIDDIFLNKR